MGTADLRLYEIGDFDGFERLGTGSFSLVFGASLKQRGSSLCKNEFGENDEDSLPLLASVNSLDSSVSSAALTEYGEPSQGGTFALKTLSVKKLRTLRKIQGAAKDLLNEVEVLSALPFHPNIIQLYGVSVDFLTSPETGFLVLERLHEPLTQVLKRWRNPIDISDLWSRRSQAERIRKVAIDLSNAMGFLHGQRILYRDLKPANCGFDKDGAFRLFDFGLAKQMTVDVHRKPTGRIGTLRYMAPEVARAEEYSYPADVHSFGMLLYEICILEAPFKNARTVDVLSAMVMNKSVAPPLDFIQSPLIQKLLEMCWSEDPGDRPDFESIGEQLKRETHSMETAGAQEPCDELALVSI